MWTASKATIASRLTLRKPLIRKTAVLTRRSHGLEPSRKAAERPICLGWQRRQTVQRGNYLTLAQPHVNIEMKFLVKSTLTFLGARKQKSRM